jgi:hypothetical protein
VQQGRKGTSAQAAQASITVKILLFLLIQKTDRGLTISMYNPLN